MGFKEGKIPIRSDFYDTQLDQDSVKHDSALRFQINDIRDYHIEDEEHDPESEKDIIKELYTLKLFGCTINGSSVELTVNGYKPFFFIEVPKGFTETDRKLLLSVVTKKLHTKGVYGNPLVKEKCTFFECEKYAEFTNHTNFKFLRLCFESMKVMRKCSFMFNYKIKYGSKCTNFDLFETDIEQLLKFIHIRGIKPAGWVSIPSKYLKKLTFHEHDIDESIGYLDNPINITANVNHRDIQFHDTIETAPFNRMAFDIECTSCDGGFPQFQRPKDPCIQIGATFKKMGAKTSHLASVYTLKEPADIKYPSVDNVYVRYFHEEKDMLLEWAKHVKNMCPDFTYGYNNNGFDWEYIYMRARKLGIHNRLLKIIGKTSDDYLPTEYKEKELNSSGLGDNSIKYIDIPGNVNIDILPVVRTDPAFKLPSYRLNAVLGYLGLASKVDLSPRELFDKFERGKPEDIRDIAVYCIRDVESCHDLIDHKKLSIIQKAQGMSNVCSIPLTYNFLRGQGIKILSLVAKDCMDSNILIPKKIKKTKNDSGYEGALVIDPVVGIHEEPIAVIDYNSLYPSIMIGYNLCKTSKVIKGSQYDNIPGVEYRDLKYRDNDGNVIECRFVLPGKKKRNQGILPRICQQLLKARKATRNKMKGETDTNVLDKLNSEQMAYKITCNSIYGQTGSQFSQLADVDIAPTICACGRNLLGLARDIAEKNYGATVVYGDSVTGDTPIICKLNEEIMVRTIDDLPSKEWYSPDNRTNKEFCNPDKGLLVWSDKGFTPIKNIIRHKTDKKIYRVTTNMGSVKVTEDHSLLDSEGNEITPKNVDFNTSLMYNDLPKLDNPDNVLQYFESYLRKHGYCKNCPSGEMLIFDDQLEAAKFCIVAETNNLNTSVTVENHSDSMKYVIHIGDKITDSSIQQIEELPQTTDYVYDLETENHHFAAGVGKLIVHNTDSIFIDFNLQKIEDKSLSKEENDIIKRTRAKELSDQLSKEITETINLETIGIEYEKIFHPFISEQRKKYRGRKYEFDMTSYKKTEMGVESKKRDYAPILADICADLTDIVMDMKDYSEVLVYVRKRIEGVLQGEEPFEKFIITKSLKAEYANPEQIAHKVLADRMTKRDPGNAPRPSERLEYCFVVTPEIFKVTKLKGGTLRVGAKEAVLTGNKIEHIDYIKKKKLEIDYPAYVEKQLMVSLVKLMMPVYITACKKIEEGTSTYTDPSDIPEPEAFIKGLIIEDYLAQQDPNVIEQLLDDFKVTDESELQNFKLDHLKKAVFRYDLNADDYHYIERVKKKATKKKVVKTIVTPAA